MIIYRLVLLALFLLSAVITLRLLGKGEDFILLITILALVVIGWLYKQSFSKPA